MVEKHTDTRVSIPGRIVKEWQSITDIIAKLIDVPAALVMRIVSDDIEVFVSSKSRGNPYHPGEKETLFGSGLYCETVIKTQKELLVPNALKDAAWRDNPDVARHMISYLGIPILWPDGSGFGTLCVLDNKENSYQDIYLALLTKFKGIIQSHLELIYMNHMLGEANRTLSDYMEEIKALRGIVPICAFCKKIRDDKGYWENVEAYVARHARTKFSHAVCPECCRKHYPSYE